MLLNAILMGWGLFLLLVLVFMRHNSSLVCMVGFTMCTLIRYLRYMGIFFYPSLPLSWMFEHDCLGTNCLGCPICFVFFYFHLFSATEHVSRGKALYKYAHYHYYYCYYYYHHHHHHHHHHHLFHWLLNAQQLAM